MGQLRETQLHQKLYRSVLPPLISNQKVLLEHQTSIFCSAGQNIDRDKLLVCNTVQANKAFFPSVRSQSDLIYINMYTRENYHCNQVHTHIHTACPILQLCYHVLMILLDWMTVSDMYTDTKKLHSKKKKLHLL